MTRYTILIPWVPPQFRTEWHPDLQFGAFSILSRGAFELMADAIVWAREHLNGCPYTIVEIKEGAE